MFDNSDNHLIRARALHKTIKNILGSKANILTTAKKSQLLSSVGEILVEFERMAEICSLSSKALRAIESIASGKTSVVQPVVSPSSTSIQPTVLTPAAVRIPSSGQTPPLLMTASPTSLQTSFSEVLKTSARNQASPTVELQAITQNSSSISTSLPASSSDSKLIVGPSSSPPVADRQNYDDVLPSSQVTQLQGSTSRTTRRIIRGTGGSDNLLVAAQRRKFFHVFYLKKDTSEKALVDYIIQKLPYCDPIVAKLVTKSDYSSFKVSIPEDNLNDFLCPQMWPSGVAISRWKFRRSVVPSKAQGTQ
jgi:hypothetical protein